MKPLECPMCHGEGFLEEYKPGGYFDRRAEQWYPLEQSRECPLCNGNGHLDKHNHHYTFNLTGDYQQLKELHETKRTSTNEVVLRILGKAA